MSFDQALTFVEDLRPFITYLESTPDNSWQIDVVRSADGTCNCMFGHLYQFTTDHQLAAGESLKAAERFASHVWDAFESSWATTYKVYPVNDGTDADYQQPTPKARVIALLKALADGTQLTTMQIMEADLAEWERREALRVS